jgi:hypothetical protein
MAVISRTPSGCQSFFNSSGGLRCASTTGDYLAAFQAARRDSVLQSLVAPHFLMVGLLPAASSENLEMKRDFGLPKIIRADGKLFTGFSETNYDR